MPLPRQLPIAAGVLVPAGVLAMLLAPSKTDLPITWLSAVLGPVAAGGTPLWWAFEHTANIALFVPLGFLLARWTGPLPGLLLGGAVSACCEVVQQTLPARTASLLDVAMNTIGAALGVTLAVLLATRSARRPHPIASADLHLAAGGALPVRPAVLGLRDVHAMQARRAVRDVEPGLVEGTVGVGQREVLAVVGAVTVHPPILTHGADTDHCVLVAER